LADEDMEQTVFQKFGIQTTDAGESPRRNHTIFRTWQKFEIKNFILISTKIFLRNLTGFGF
jgi:hypothetical protein